MPSASSLSSLLSGKKTVSAVVTLAIVKILEQFGYSLAPAWQDTIEIVLAALVVIFMRWGILKSGPEEGPKNG